MHSEIKKYSKKFAPLAITAAFFTMPLLSGCAAGVGTAWCDFSTNNVHNSTGTPSDMVAKSRATCSSAVHVSGYIEIEKQGFLGTWSTYAHQEIEPFTATPGKQVTRQVAAPCAKGSFRNKTHVVASYDGETKSGTMEA